MPGKYSFLLLSLLLSLSLFTIPSLNAQDNSGFGYYQPDRTVPCMTPAQHIAIEKKIKESQDHLRAIGILPEVQDRAFTTLFAWPLAQNNGLDDYDYHGISNFVDQNMDYPDMLLDYNCGNRTYDLSSGYNHAGTDIFLWPFAWYKMEHDQVKIVAAAPGIIVYKSDGNFDHNCGFNNLDWNAVYVQHADGSVAWYGHMKNGSLTTKTIGETVATGEYLGLVGSSGSSSAPHLHFEVHDAGNFLIDPWSGNCNSLNTQSWWIDQRPYYDSGLNALRTQSGPPVFPACPEVETTNEKNQFCGGDEVYCAAYYRDQLDGQQVDYKVFRPDNSIYQQWSQTFDVYYSGSYWYWSFTLPSNAPTGVWIFQVTYLGNVFEKQFDVNGNTHIAAAGNTTICPGDEVTLSAPLSQYGFSYQWKKNNADIPGATASTYAANASGNYTCSISTVNGCSTNSNFIVITISDVPQATINPPGPISICDGTIVTFCASGGTEYTWLNSGAPISTMECIDVNYTGDFTVQVANDNGCTSLAIATVTVFPNPVVDLGDDIIYLTGTDTVLNAEGPGLTYLWNTGETTPSITVSEDGLYSVTVTDGNGCEGTDEVEVLGSSSTSDVNKVEGISIYPNPAGDYIDVVFTNQVWLRSSRICLYNLQGELLSTHIVADQEGSQRIAVSSLAPGIYFLYVSSGREYGITKFTKSR